MLVSRGISILSSLDEWKNFITLYLLQSGRRRVHLRDGLLHVVDLVVDALLVPRDLPLAVDPGRVGGVGDAAGRAGGPVGGAVPAGTLPGGRAG